MYELHVPADQPVLLERSLRVLRQLALEVKERRLEGVEARGGKRRGCAAIGAEMLKRVVISVIGFSRFFA